MNQKVIIRPGSYHDSAYLMRLARELSNLEGISEAVVLMGTGMNCQLLKEAGFEDPQLHQATPMDLLLALRATHPQALDAAVVELDRLMQAASRGTVQDGSPQTVASIAQAILLHPDINLVSVAVPGQYAAYPARQALGSDRHVFLFSDNVALADEVSLKDRARERGLLMMGPDCGTAMLAGVGLGFMNRVRRGNIGIVGASGTGTQEVACLLHRYGLGISQAIGVGSRDLSKAVDGRMSEFACQLLDRDDDTEIIVLVAKHPDEAVADRIHQVLAGLSKPVVVRYLGTPPPPSGDPIQYADSLDHAAELAARLAGCEPEVDPLPDPVPSTAKPGRLLGLFGGGSLASEAALILTQAGLTVEVPGEPLADGSLPGSGHLVVDTGDDFYTRGKPHPMVDQSTRCEMIRTLGGLDQVSLILIDLVLGDGSHPDPAPELCQALAVASKPAVASVTGTELDPQNAKRQMDILSAAGVQVQPSGARAARLAAVLLGGQSL